MDGSSIMCSIAYLTILFSWTFTPGFFLGFGMNCSGVVGIFRIQNIWYCRDLTAHDLNWRHSDQNFGRKGAHSRPDILENLAEAAAIHQRLLTVELIRLFAFLPTIVFEYWPRRTCIVRVNALAFMRLRDRNYQVSFVFHIMQLYPLFVVLHIGSPRLDLVLVSARWSNPQVQLDRRASTRRSTIIKTHIPPVSLHPSYPTRRNKCNSYESM